MTSAERVTLCEMFQRTVGRRPDEVALSAPGRSPVTWREYGARVESIASGLLSLGVRDGAPTALMMCNTPEFHLLDTAVMHAGAVPFSLHADDPVESLADRVALVGARVIVVEPRYLETARALVRLVDGLQVVVAGDGAACDELELADVERQGSGRHEAFVQAWQAVTPGDVATLIFTSGTTGRPKAVQLPHRAITVSLQNFLRLAPGGEDGRVLSYLPLTHIAERFMSHYLSLGYGAEICCVVDPDRLYDEIVRVRPTRFFGVPRVYAKLADRARRVLATDPHADVGAELGLDRTHYRGVATAPSSAEMLTFLASVGLPVGDIWGMSEAIMCTTNPTAKIKIGTVGRLLDEVEARVDDDGELLVRGPNMFVGYLNDPQRTAELRGDDGWIRTGDLGSVDDEGYLTIIGRKKELMITATGRNVVPAVVEAALRDASPLIDHVVAIGDGRRYVTALIVLDGAQLTGHAGTGTQSFAELAAHPDVLAEIERAVANGNAKLGRAETVRSWRVLDVEWRPGGDEITFTMKLRRSEIAAKYADEIESLYAAPATSSRES